MITPSVLFGKFLLRPKAVNITTVSVVRIRVSQAL